jgi:hypothetical protein
VFTIISLWQMHSLQQQFVTIDLPDLFFPPPAPKTIAYAISLTECNPESANLDAAAVLRYSIRRFDSTKYDSKFYAFVHPNAVTCSAELSRMGYEIQVRQTPINVTDIRGPLKKYVEGASCCGSTEFLKLYAYTLVDHPVVVHLDMDVAVLKSLEDLFDSMLEGSESPARHRLPAMWANNATDLPKRIDAFFTRDYNMLAKAGFREPLELSIQGGFLVIRPDRAAFQEYVDTILEGQYLPDSGWGGPALRFGGTYGGAQVQGLAAYFYGHLHPGTSVELNRCNYNNMVDKPVDEKNGTCLAPREDGFCEDCRSANLSNVWTTHYTVCQKPWRCDLHKEKLCRELHHEWFRLRLGLENEIKKSNPSYSITAVNTTGEMPWIVDGNRSFCTQGGPNGYIKMQQYA